MPCGTVYHYNDPMARVFVTGATGFIGGHLVAALCRNGHDVTCLVRPTSRVEYLERLGVRLAMGDVQDPASVERAVPAHAVVYHLAGRTKALSYKQLLAVNHGGVEHVVRAAAAQSRPPVLVIVSSLAAAGPSTADRPRCEQDPPAPVSNYGWSKFEGERAAARRAADLPISIVRPPVVLGEGDRAGFLMFRMIARRGLHLVPAMGSSRISLVHVADLIHALLAVAHQGRRLEAGCTAEDYFQSGVYFAAADEMPAYAELGQMIGRTVQRDHVPVVHAPRVAVRMAAWACEGFARVRRRPSLLNYDKFREATAGSWTCNTARIRTELGVRPGRSLQERLQQTTDWYRRQRWL